MKHRAKAPSPASTVRQANWRLRRTGIAAAALALTAFLGIAAPAAMAEPTESIEPITTSSITTAHVSGQITTDETGETYWGFEYRPVIEGQGAEDNWTTSPHSFSAPLAPETTTAVADDLTGLDASTEYEVRIFAFPFSDFTYHFAPPPGEPGPAFTTAAAPNAPTLAVKPAASIAYNAAHIEGTMNPEGGNEDAVAGPIPITAQLELNRDGEGWAPVGNPLTIEGAEAVSNAEFTLEAQLEGLSTNASYAFRLKATYAGEEALSASEEFETEHVNSPEVQSLNITNLTSESAHFAGVVNSGGPGPGEATEYRFECVEGCPGLPRFQPIASDGTDQSVELDAEGLFPNRLYHVKLIARDAAGLEASEEVEFKTGALPPVVETLPADNLGPAHASLQGTINPENSPTTYYYEYGTTTEYGTEIPLPPASVIMCPFACELDLENSDHPVALYGLQPGSTYHYRLIAENEAGRSVGQDREFTTTVPPSYGSCPNQALREAQHATYLPDCRAYEQVSTQEKNGSDVVPDSGRTRAAADGSALSYDSLGNFAGTEGSAIATEYMAIRSGQPGTSGWSTHPIIPPEETMTVGAVGAGYESAYEDLSPDLGAGVFRSYTPLTGNSDVAGVENLYLRSDVRNPGHGSYQLITACPACQGTPLHGSETVPQIPRFAAASADRRHIIFESPFALTADAALEPFTAFCDNYGVFGCLPKLFESEDGRVRLVGILPDGSVARTSFAGRGATHFAYTESTISSDGSRVVFTVPQPGCPDFEMSQTCGDLYMRVNHSATVQINSSERTPCLQNPESCAGEFSPATFRDMTPDGNRVFFTTSQPLTDGDTNGVTDIYRYEVDAPAHHHLTRLTTTSAEPHPSIIGVIGASHDGSYVYFIAEGQVVPGGPSVSLEGIFVWHDGSIHYIGEATAGFDQQFDLPLQTNFTDDARVTPDGSHLLYMSVQPEGPRTGYDQGHTCAPGAEPGKGNAVCGELYIYDALSERLSCVSCNPSGEPATSAAQDNVLRFSGGSHSASHLSHALSDAGHHVFFTTEEALVPQDTNGASDVYEYDVPTGTVHLISSGIDEKPSFFLDATPDGRNVFFATRQRLVGWDTDGAYDVYDARIEGGFPEPTPRPAPCASGDTCQTHSTPAEASGAGSSTLTAPGNRPPHRACPRERHRDKARAARSHCAGHHRHKHHRAGRRRDRAPRGSLMSHSSQGSEAEHVTSTNRRAGR